MNSTMRLNISFCSVAALDYALVHSWLSFLQMEPPILRSSKCRAFRRSDSPSFDCLLRESGIGLRTMAEMGSYDHPGSDSLGEREQERESK